MMSLTTIIDEIAHMKGYLSLAESCAQPVHLALFHCLLSSNMVVDDIMCNPFILIPGFKVTIDALHGVEHKKNYRSKLLSTIIILFWEKCWLWEEPL